jgi:hypothetical protein
MGSSCHGPAARPGAVGRLRTAPAFPAAGSWTFAAASWNHYRQGSDCRARGYLARGYLARGYLARGYLARGGSGMGFAWVSAASAASANVSEFGLPDGYARPPLSPRHRRSPKLTMIARAKNRGKTIKRGRPAGSPASPHPATSSENE